MKTRKNLYADILASVTAAITATIIVLAVIQYFSARAALLDRIYDSERGTLAQISYSARLMTNYAAQIAFELFSDPDITTAISTKDLSAEQITRVQHKLESVEGSTPFVHSLYAYNDRDRVFLVGSMRYILYAAYREEEFFDQEALRILRNFHDHRKEAPIPRRVRLPEYAFQGSVPVMPAVYTFFFVERAWSRRGVIINVPRKWMENAITSIGGASGARTFVVNDSGLIVADSSISDTETTYLTDVRDLPFGQALWAAEDRTGYFTTQISGVPTLMIYLDFEQLGWRFVRLLPLDRLLRQTRSLMVTSLATGALILVLGFLVSLIVARRLARPYTTMLGELRLLERERRENRIVLREDFLRNVVLRQNYGKLDPPPLPARSDHVQVVDLLKPVSLLVVTVDGYSEFCFRYSFDRRSVTKFGIMKKVLECLRRQFPCESVDMGNQNMVVLINGVDESTSTETARLLRLAQAEAIQVFKESLTFTLSRPAREHGEISHFYEQTVTESMYRVYEGPGCLFLPGDVRFEPDHSFVYPQEKERLMVEALLGGSLQQAQGALDSIIQQTTCYPYAVFRTTMAHLAYGVNAAFLGAKGSGRRSYDLGVHAFLEELDRLESVAAVRDHFVVLFRRVRKNLDSQKESRHASVVEEVDQIIQDDYMDPNLSVDLIADRVGMSPGYLGQIYRHHSGRSISEHIRSERLERAILRMQETDQSLEEIALSVGFSNSPYFYRVFKKRYGVTPRQHRVSQTPGSKAN